MFARVSGSHFGSAQAAAIMALLICVYAAENQSRLACCCFRCSRYFGPNFERTMASMEWYRRFYLYQADASVLRNSKCFLRVRVLKDDAYSLVNFIQIDW